LQEDGAPFLTLDSLLLPMLVNNCPFDVLPAVIAVIPTYLSTAKILKWINSKGTFASYDVSKIKAKPPPTHNLSTSAMCVHNQITRIFLIQVKALISLVKSLTEVIEKSSYVERYTLMIYHVYFCNITLVLGEYLMLAFLS
jgi:hypothetical protein